MYVLKYFKLTHFFIATHSYCSLLVDRCLLVVQEAWRLSGHIDHSDDNITHTKMIPRHQVKLE